MMWQSALSREVKPFFTMTPCVHQTGGTAMNYRFIAVPCSWLLRAPILVECDDDFSAGVSSFKIAKRFSSLMQWVASIDNRHDAADLKQLLHEGQILLCWMLHKGAELLSTLFGVPWPNHHDFEKLST